MSDSDCSNCDKTCMFRDYDYNCYVKVCLDIKKATSKKQQETITHLFDVISDLYKNTGIDNFLRIKCALDELNDCVQEDDEILNRIINQNI